MDENSERLQAALSRYQEANDGAKARAEDRAAKAEIANAALKAVKESWAKFVEKITAVATPLNEVLKHKKLVLSHKPVTNTMGRNMVTWQLAADDGKRLGICGFIMDSEGKVSVTGTADNACSLDVGLSTEDDLNRVLIEFIDKSINEFAITKARS